jgi:hypothetical protein
MTPPNIYAVSFREKPFHGVRALRMKPVGDGNMYGRDGILAHSYLLGEQGASNGYVSVRDYDKFLQAYEDGKFDRIIVVRSGGRRRWRARRRMGREALAPANRRPVARVSTAKPGKASVYCNEPRILLRSIRATIVHSLP